MTAPDSLADIVRRGLREMDGACPCRCFSHACGPLVCHCNSRRIYAATGSAALPPPTAAACLWPGHAASRAALRRVVEETCTAAVPSTCHTCTEALALLEEGR